MGKKKENLDEFVLQEREVWVAMLDGCPVQGRDKMACSNKGDISRSFTQSLRNIYRDYGFESAVKMKNALVDKARLEFVKLDTGSSKEGIKI